MTSITVRPVEDIGEVLALAKEASREGHAFVSRLIREWREGSNRFDAPGERLFVAAVDGRVAGLCGLNVDPYTRDPAVGRVRHLYVAPAFRRTGVGSALVFEVVEQARGTFSRLHLRTYEPEAARFYESLGFSPVTGEATCTHMLPLAAG